MKLAIAICVLVLGLGRSSGAATGRYVVIDKNSPPPALIDFLARVATQMHLAPTADGRLDDPSAVRLRAEAERVAASPAMLADLPAKPDAAGLAAVRAGIESPPIAGYLAERQAAKALPLPPFGSVLAKGTCKRWDERSGRCVDCDLPVVEIEVISMPDESPPHGAIANDLARCEVRLEAPPHNLQPLPPMDDDGR